MSERIFKQLKQQNIFLPAFTLAEVLITLVIIGVIAAVTIPQISIHYKMKQYKTGVIKAQANLQNAVNLYRLEMGKPVECRYWKNSPYSGARCVSYNSNGDCSKYEMPDGSPLPSDYNGYFSDCTRFWNYLKTRGFRTAKVCNSNGYANGCMQDYAGNDTIWRDNHASTNPNPTDYEVNQATSGCGGMRRQNLRSGQAIVSADGMIWFTYSDSYAAIMFVDVNGAKGPNKWGHDVHGFISRGNEPDQNPTYYPGLSCISVEKGGVATQTLITSAKY